MSLIRTQTIPCPNCGTANQVEVFYSINADRRSDLRAAVVDRTLQQVSCTNCAAVFRVDPDLNYLDLARGQWIAVHPLSSQPHWQIVLPTDLETFDEAYGTQAAAGAQEIGQELAVRVTFGWAGFREKLIAAEAGLDDQELELLKMAILREEENPLLARNAELRLVDVADGQLVMCWLDAQADTVKETLLVPMRAYETIAADSIGWAALRAEIRANAYVDMNRLLT